MSMFYKWLKKIVLGLILLTQTQLNSQDTLTIKFDPEYHITQDPGLGFMKLLDNHNNQVYYDGKMYTFKFPNQFYYSDTAIAFNYFTGWKEPKIENATAFLFGNYKSHSPIMYVDYNHNLDFSDDGQAIKFALDSTAIVYLKNTENPYAYFPIKFYYPKLNPEDKSEIEPMFLKMGPDVKGNNTVSIDYWLADPRMNYKHTNTRLNGQNLKLGLYDYNCNGLYNDLGEDIIIIGNYEENSISHRSEQGVIEYIKNTQIILADEVYEVLDIGPIGDYIKLIKSNKKYIKPLGTGDNISNMEIKMISGELITIKELQHPGKFILLNFWGSWCQGCKQQLPFLKKLIGKYSEKLQILGLNYGDKTKVIHRFISKHKIDWINAYSSDEMMKNLRIRGFPTLLLLSPMGEILIMNGSLEEIEKKL